MDNERLISMANQIGDFFKAYPDQAQAEKDIAAHINKFWAWQMRDSIAAHVQNQQGEGLDPLVKRAISQYLAA